MIAAAAPPPAAGRAVGPNCAAPATTKADITIAASGPITGRATTPNDRPSSTAAAPNGSPALMPSRMVAGRSAVTTDMTREAIGRLCSTGRGDDARGADPSPTGAGSQPPPLARPPALSHPPPRGGP